MPTVLSPDAPLVRPSPGLWRRAIDAFTAWAAPLDCAGDGYEPYPDIDQEQLAADLELQVQAARHGAGGHPAEGTARDASFEPAIDARIIDLVDGARQRAAKRLQDIGSAARNINLDHDTGHMVKLDRRFRAEADKVLGNGRRELQEVADTHRRIGAETNAFRRTHGLERAARIPDSRLWTWAVLILIVVAETAMNGVFFAEGSDLGLLGGAMQAAVISLVNVGVAGVVAHWPLRWLVHRSAALRITGGLLLVGYLVALAGAALVVTLYREAFTVDPDAAFAAVMEAVRSGNVEPTRFDSWLFLGLSVCFAFAALHKVYHMDDPYPGFGAAERRRRTSESDARQERERLADQLETCLDDCTAQLAELAVRLERAGDRLDINRNVHDKIVGGWAPYAARLSLAHAALVGRFRQENRLARTSPAPGWFDRAPALALDVFVPNAQVLPDVTGARAAVRTLQGQVAERRHGLTERYNEIVHELDAVFDARAIDAPKESLS